MPLSRGGNSRPVIYRDEMAVKIPVDEFHFLLYIHYGYVVFQKHTHTKVKAEFVHT